MKGQCKLDNTKKCECLVIDYDGQKLTMCKTESELLEKSKQLENKTTESFNDKIK